MNDYFKGYSTEIVLNDHVYGKGEIDPRVMDYLGTETWLGTILPLVSWVVGKDCNTVGCM